MFPFKIFSLLNKQTFVNKSTKLLLRRLSNASAQKQEECKERVVILDPCCRIAVIAGGTEGIGLAVGRQLLCAKANQVLLLGIDTAKGLEAVNTLNCSFGKNKCAFIKCDLKDKKQTQSVINKIKTQFKNVEIFVNTVGIWDEQNWEEQLHVNLMGTINFNLAITKSFPKKNVVVINFSGVDGLQPFPASPIYSAGNAGITHFSQNLGHLSNFKHFGVRVIALCTGTTTCTELLNGVEGKMLTPEMGTDLQASLKESQKQKPDACGKAVIEIIKYGFTGSVWAIEGSRLVHLDIPHWREHRVLISQFT